MSINLRLALFLFSISIIFLTTYILKKGRIPEKYSLLWYLISLVILVLSIFPDVFIYISSKIGFQVMSNMIVGVFLVLLILLTMALTIIVSGQKKKTTLLIQEISMLKSEACSNDKKK